MTRVIETVSLTGTDTGGSTGTVNEPSLAMSGKRVLVAGNWFASRSTDRGASWSFVNPFREFPSTSGSFCCDQVLMYVRSHRLWVWLLQYEVVGDGNLFRLAVSKTGAPDSWTWWDTRPTDIDLTWTDRWFDYPDLATTDENLWVSFNVYGVSDREWDRAVVMRFGLDALNERGDLERAAWSTTVTGGLRFTRGADRTMWFVGHGDDNESVHLFSWDDDENHVDEFSTAVTAWNETDYESVVPGGADWLARTDGRITGCWIDDDHLGFAWNSGGDAAHNHPYIRCARLARDTLDLVDEPDLWSSDRAWAYAAIGLNKRGDVGMSAFCGGAVPITHAVGSLGENGWDMATVAVSTHGPANEAWGDYVDIQRDPSRTTYWVATGFTLQGGGGRPNVTPHVVTFAP